MAQMDPLEKFLVRCGAFMVPECQRNRTTGLWAPVVPRGYLITELARIESLELQINEEYEKCVNELRREARTTTRDTGNPFFRALQILEHLRG